MSPDDKRHGTYAGFLAHRSEGEEQCEPCRLARNAYMADLRKRPGFKAREQRANRARSRAVWRLVELHRDEFQTLYLIELAAEARTPA